MFRSGFVSIIGRPNVGKSTLLNKIIGEKTAITSDKPQTTRNQIRAVLNTESYQIIFIDTPGIHKPKHRLGDFMVKSARSTLNDVELVLFLVDVQSPPGKGDLFIIEWLKGVDTPVILIANKKDQVSAEITEKHLALYRELYPFRTFFAISALYDENNESLINEIIDYMPEGPQYYPPGMTTDRPDYFMVSELIREKVLHLTREEIPFSVAIEIEEMKKRKNRDLVDIRAVIFVEKKSQKGIIIGKSGSMLKEIGVGARSEIETLLGNRVFLELWVKVSPDWRNKDNALRNLGYRNE